MKYGFSWLVTLALAAPAFGQHSTIVPGMCVPEDHIINGTLDAMRAQPETYLSQKVRFEARFHRTGDVYQPFYTVFDAFQHMNFSAWDAATDIHTKAGFMKHHALLYVAKTNIDAIENLSRLGKYEAFLCVGVVRSVFDGQAFIEIVDIDRCFEAPKDPTCCDVHAKEEAGRTGHATTASATPSAATESVTIERDESTAEAPAATNTETPTAAAPSTSVEATQEPAETPAPAASKS
ncbi:MAG: hypothetical protein IPH13_06320 [Planctomycetes bacterium]|nr:hypothetical protein [Planctomycetota bacterium]MCC7172475.1 hypothetical protein [Planctomycetota bacterium]